MPLNPVQIAWCATAANTVQYAEFFASNVTDEYISHSELQGPRTDGRGRWHPELRTVLRDEMATRIERGRGVVDGLAASYPVLTAHEGSQLVGLALVSFFPDAPTPFGIVEDIVVSRNSRSAGIGKAILDWISREAEQIKCKRLFLESGLGNEAAHHFFEREGFATCSIMMMKTLKA